MSSVSQDEKAVDKRKSAVDHLTIRCAVVRNNRITLLLNESYDGVKEIGKHRYIWLKHNPSFKEIPKGYVIHHLDHDKINNDPSNLVLMAKYHHMAYHAKNTHLDDTIEIEIDPAGYHPISKPWIGFRKSCNKFTLDFKEIIDGKTIRRRPTKIYGKPLLTREDAETARDLIWREQEWYQG